MSSRSKEVKYRPSLVSFFDILGFSAMVKSRPPAEIASHVELFQATGEISKETHEAFEAQSFQFSDSVVRIMPLDSDANTRYPHGALFHEILVIVHACLEMAYRGVLIRGSLTIGDAYVSGSTMFGPGMLRAHELESRVAVYPRVVVDPAALEALKTDPRLKKDTHRVADEVAYVLEVLRRDSDGVWFVDYLHAAYEELDDPSSYGDLLGNHKRTIDGLLEAQKSLDDLAVKILWSAQYHNQVLDRLLEEGGTASMINPHRVVVPARLLASLP